MHFNFGKKLIIGIFCLSVATEILLYFLITSNLKLSRILQFFLILILILSFFFKKKIRFDKLPFNDFIEYYLIFTFIITLSFFINNFTNIDNYLMVAKQTIIYLYYLFFFIILNIYIIDNKDKFIFFVRFIRKIFIIFLYLGFIIYLVKYFYDIHLIDRHLYSVFDNGFINSYKQILGLIENENRLDIGLRYYGFFGEPRDSAVIILFGMTLLVFENYYLERLKNFKLHIFFCICALFATLSMTLMISLFFILPLIFLLNIKTFFNIRILLALSILLIVTSIFLLNSIRLNLYILEFLVYYNADSILVDLFTSNELYTFKELNIDKIKNLGHIPSHLSNQAISFQPILTFIQYFFDLEIMKFLFGNGLSSSYYYNLSIQRENFEATYPPSQLTRIVYEGGLICFILWILAFYIPLKKILKNNYNKQGSKLLFFVYMGLLSASLIHRSISIYIIVGIFINYYYIFLKNDLSNN